MKQLQAASIKDGKLLKRSKRNDAPFYTMVQKKKGMCTVTSLASDRTYSLPFKTLVWVNK